MCNTATNNPLGNGAIFLIHSSEFWNKHPQYLRCNGNSISTGTLNFENIDNITVDR